MLIVSYSFLAFKFSFWKKIYSRKKDILETATVNFLLFFFFFFFLYSVRDDWIPTPLLVPCWKPCDPTKSFSDCTRFSLFLEYILKFNPSGVKETFVPGKQKWSPTALLKLPPQSLQITRTYLSDKSRNRYHLRTYKVIQSYSVDVDPKQFQTMSHWCLVIEKNLDSLPFASDKDAYELKQVKNIK